MEYSKLDFSRFETRFLRLVEPISDQVEFMRFELDTASLSHPPRYKALSYCWGDISQCGKIEVDGKQIEISTNLFDALRHVRLETGSLIWADAICINQVDLYEKSYQVNLMGQIYSKSMSTIVWLGLEGRSSRFAEELLLRYESSLRSWRGSSAMEPAMLEEEPNNRAVSEESSEFKRTLRLLERPTRALHGLHELLTRPYWERVWIIQEIAKAASVDIRCGDLRFKLDSLLSAAKSLNDLPRRNQTLLQAVERFRRLEQQRLGVSSRMSLLEGLVATRYSLATDERDKIYAILGLARDGHDLMPTPSYTDSISDVFIRLTTEMLQSHMVTDVPLLAKWAPLTIRSPSAPPWAVDWADLGFSIPPWLFSTTVSIRLTEPSQHHSILKSLDGVNLQTSGQQLATIPRNTPQRPWRPSYKSISEFSPKPKEAVSGTMRRLCSDLLDHLAPGNAAAGTVNRDDLTDALSRMIRDAEKGFTSFEYDLSATQDVLEGLGETFVAGEHVREWARQYNFLRVSVSRSEDQLVIPKDSAGNASGRRRSFWKRESKRLSDNITLTSTSSTEPSEAAKSGHPRSIPLIAFRVWVEILTSLDMSPEFKAKFMTIDNDRLILVSEAALERDVVYQISHCRLPVVLRRSVTGTFQLIGEACLERTAAGDWVAAKDLAPISSTLPQQHVSKDQQLTIEFRLLNEEFMYSGPL